MVDETATEDLGDGVEAAARPQEGGANARKLVLFMLLPILLVLGVAAGAYFGGVLDPLLGAANDQEEAAAAPGETASTVFYDLPEMLVNLNGVGRKSSYLKISVSLELEDPAGLELVDRVLPRIVDSFQIYLRELRIEDLNGSAGLQRLREELLLRVNTAVRPSVVKDVLFKEMLIQ
jgi:flagellar FliL protein